MAKRYYAIISHLPKKTQRRILTFVEEIFDTPDVGDICKQYNVKNAKEAVQHLAECESGTSYLLEDPLISDYKNFWAAFDAVRQGGHW